MLTWLVLSPLAGADLRAGEPATQITQAGYFRVTVQSALTPVDINRMHGWIVSVQTADGTPVTNAIITVGGGMPTHDHGLPTAPRVTENLGDGRYRVEGVKFHMNGLWELTVDVQAASRSDTARFELAL